MERFDSFYAIYPRKEGKKDAFKAWSQISQDQQSLAIEAIHKHAARWQALGTEKHFIPLPGSWLRGWRFDDEIEMPSIKPVFDWRKSDTATLAKGKEAGCLPRPGEDMFAYRERLSMSLNKKTA